MYTGVYWCIKNILKLKLVYGGKSCAFHHDLEKKPSIGIVIFPGLKMVFKKETCQFKIKKQRIMFRNRCKLDTSKLNKAWLMHRQFVIVEIESLW